MDAINSNFDYFLGGSADTFVFPHTAHILGFQILDLFPAVYGTPADTEMEIYCIDHGVTNETFIRPGLNSPLYNLQTNFNCQTLQIGTDNSDDYYSIIIQSVAASSTPQYNVVDVPVLFGIGIIVTVVFFGVIAFIFNSLGKKKPWR